MAFALKGTGTLFSGDHVMGWSTTIVAPPDGAMSDCMASLRRLATRPETTYLAGHGDVIRNAPDYVAQLVRHRLGREAAILSRLAKGEAEIASLVRSIYVGLDPRLAGAAALSVLAHLEDLVARGLVATDGAPSLAGRYRLAR
jgi:glyoxylase-like metal-dependent hydrolase (beta-lactamase superfamily II)